MRRSILASIALFTLSIHGQTLTTVDGAGHTIIQVITTDANGLPITQAIQTLTSASQPPANTNTPTTTTPTTAPPTTTTTTPGVITVTQGPVQQGPVGQPAPTTVGQPNGVTPYVYTTVVGGVTQVVSDNFTPTNPVTVSQTIGTSGSIMDYSVWLSIYGSKTTGAAAVNAGESLKIWYCEHLVMMSVVVGLGIGIL